VKPTIFLMGPSDIEGQSWTKQEASGNDRIKASGSWSGVLPIQPFVWSDNSLKEKSFFYFIGINKDVRLHDNVRVNLFNLVGDPDASATSLRTVEAMKNKIQPLRYFNPVSAVLKTARQKLPDTLANIPGCRVPRVKVSNPTSFTEFEKACDEFNSWPLIVRARGYHGGENMILLQDRPQVKAMEDITWLYNGVFLMEFVDYRNEENLYQTTRVIFVDGVPYPRHSIISDRWTIHSASRRDLMDHDVEVRDQEERFLGYLGDACLNEHGAVFSTIQERIGLDIFGVDFAFVDNQFIIFEANACMAIFGIGHSKDCRYRYLETYKMALKRAVKKMLMTA